MNKNNQLFISIKTQFVMLAMLLMAFLAALWGWWYWDNERRLHYVGLEKEGRQMLSSLASPIINAQLYGEMGLIEEGGLLDNFIEEIMDNPGFPVVHAFIADESGKVLAHNNYSEFGKIYTDPLTLSAVTEKRYISNLIPGSYFQPSMLDMAMPLYIHGKIWGTLRVGVSTAPLEEALHNLKLRIAGVSLVFFLFGTMVSYLIGLNMARPLRQLTALMSAVSTENLALEMPPRRPDEIGALQESFQQMLERLRRSEAERERALAHLIQNEKLASIGKIVAGVAHEVNNPLATIGTCIHNLEQDCGGPNRNLEILKQGSERIERIVRQLTDFSRAGALEIQAVGSSHFFDEIREFGRMTLKNRMVQLIARDLCTPPITLYLDKGKIHQVILNLLINAADASQEGGEIHLTAVSDSDSYVLSVHDRGGGIPPEACDHIFDIFYTTKPAGGGTGIGLAICKSIVEMHGGELTFESSSNETTSNETTFAVRLPLSPFRGNA